MTSLDDAVYVRRKWAAIGAGTFLAVVGVAAVAAGSTRASLLPDITGPSSTTGLDVILLAVGVAACAAVPFVLAAVSGRAAWGATGLGALTAGTATVFATSALDPEASASGVLGLAVAVAAAVALRHRFRSELAARGALLVVYGGLVLLGPRLPAATAILVLPATGLVDALAGALPEGRAQRR